MTDNDASAPLTQPEPEHRPIWEVGGYGEGAAILKDGVMQPIEDVIAALNSTTLAQSEPELREIGERLRTQDNRCTADPVFQVRVRRRIYGMDPQWMDDPVWIDTEDGAREVDPPADPDNPPEFVIQTGYIDVWEVKMVAFTEEGCKEHLRLNGHNYRHFQEVQIYADYLNRCPEMIAIRNALMALPAPTPTSPTQPPNTP